MGCLQISDDLIFHQIKSVDYMDQVPDKLSSASLRFLPPCGLQ